MADRRAKYKQRGDNFGDLETSRMSRLEKQDQRRKEIRRENFSRLRPLEEITSQTPGKSDVQISRNEKLAKWKKQKELKIKKEKQVIKKPPFKVGIVHHKLYSPPINNPSLPSCSHWNTNCHTKNNNIHSSKMQPATVAPIKKITRVTEKRLAAKAAAAALLKQSFAPPNYKFKPPAGLSNIPIFGRVRKGSMDVSTLSWNLNGKKSPRKKSSLLSRVSPQKIEKKDVSFQKQFKKSPKKSKSRVSISRSQLNSSSSVDSESLPVFSDEIDVFDSEEALPAEEEMENNAAFTDLVEPLETSLSPIKSNELSQSTDKSPDKEQIETANQFEQESINYSLKLHVTDLSVSNFKETRLNLSRSDSEVCNFQKIEQYTSQDYSLKLQATDLSDSKQTAEHLQSKAERMNDSSSDCNKSMNDTLNVALFSPYVVTRRGKKEARKEQQIRRGFNHSPKEILQEIPTKETVMQNMNISIDEEKRTSQYFRCLLESETNRLDEQCNRWSDIIASENPPEEARELIEQAIGQTKLLIRSKFKQFEGLVRQCEEGLQDQLVTCKDLQGFWDMMSLTVNNCEGRFEKVEQLKANDWIEEVKIVQVPSRKRIPSKKKSPVKKPPVRSNLRAKILAERLRKKQQLENNSENNSEANEKPLMEIWQKSPNLTSRRLSIAPEDSASKERRLSFARAAMMISQKRKTPENLKTAIQTQEEDEPYEVKNLRVHLDESISYINSKQTPGKSILKRVKVEPDTSIADDSRILRSTQKVNFNDTVQLKEVEVEEDQEAKNRRSLAESLARIDSMNFDDECVPEVNIRAEKKLNFEDMSFSENPQFDDDVFYSSKKKTPDLNIIAPTPSRDSEKTLPETEQNTRVTRNRKATIDSQSSSTVTPKSPRLIKKRKLNSDLENLVIDDKKITPKSPRLISKSKLSAEIENLLFDDKGKKKTPKSPRLISKSKLNAEIESLLIDDVEKKTPKSPRLTRRNKINADIENSSLDDTKEKKIAPKSPRLINRSKFNSSVNHSILEELEDHVESDDEDLYRRSLRNRTIIGSLTPKSAKKMKKETPVLAKLGNSASNSRVNIESSNLSLLERENSLRSSKRILRSPVLKLTPSKKTKSILTPLQQTVHDESEHEGEGEEKNSSFLNESRRTQRKMEKTNELDKKVTPKEKKKSESPLEKIAKVKNSFSLLYKLMKTPISETKKSKIANDSTENMELDFETESDESRSSRCRKMRRTPKATPTDNKSENKEDSILKKESLHLSLVKKKNIPESKMLSRSFKIPADEMHNEKENTSPIIFKRKSSINSPKPIETPSKRKSIKRSMSCHVAECQVDYPSTPQLQRSNSSRLSKTASNRRSIKQMTSVSP